MDDLIKLLYDRIPYYSILGFELQEISNGRAIFEIKIRDKLTQYGLIHGGVLASLVDSICAYTAISLILPKGYVTTIDLQVEFLKPVSSGRLKAIAKCIKSGKNIFFCKAKVWNEKGDLICTGSSQLLRIE
ncbi:MAG: PaaI family thioesterase [Candidatus Lokiarchaeota archaeon]|nr:PaaI family thioesterase [Candidatus Lokiarchaeota archaeon]